MSTSPIGEVEAVELMDTIIRGTPTEVAEAVNRIEEAQDERFIPVLIDAYRGWQLRLLRTADARPIIRARTKIRTTSWRWPYTSFISASK